jgi:hypothetical protein
VVVVVQVHVRCSRLRIIIVHAREEGEEEMEVESIMKQEEILGLADKVGGDVQCWV